MVGEFSTESLGRFLMPATYVRIAGKLRSTACVVFFYLGGLRCKVPGEAGD